MYEYAHYFNILFGTGAIFFLALSIFIFVSLCLKNKESKTLDFIKENFILLSLIVSGISLLCSLFYSEVLNYLPCFHCWVQRIFLFPQVLLFAVAYARKDRNVIFYSVPLVLIGLVDALYLNYIYYFNPNSAPCDASGVSCVQKLVSEFGGYVSIPSLALVSFVTLLAISSVAFFYDKED